MHVQMCLYGRLDLSASPAGYEICLAGYVQFRPDVQWQNVNDRMMQKGKGMQTCNNENINKTYE